MDSLEKLDGPEVNSAEGHAAPQSWWPVDISVALEDDGDRLRPSVGYLTDTCGLLYPGKTHSLSSEPEAGKTWLALAQAQHEMSQNRPVLYIDHEDDARSVVGRLVAMGVESEVLTTLFHYVRPDEPLRAHASHLERLVQQVSPALVIIDGVTEAMTLESLSLMDNQDTAEFFRSGPTKIANLGPAVLLLDHEVKRSGSDSRFALGAQHKLAAISGAAFKLRPRSPFAVGTAGSSTLVVVKDRHGLLRQRGIARESGAQVLAYLKVESGGTDFVDVRLTGEAPPNATVSDDFKERVVGACVKHPAGFDTKAALKKVVGGNSKRATDAINALIDEGVISPPPIRLTGEGATRAT